MFNLIDTFFDCKICYKVLCEPVILPCGITVCKFHSDLITQGNCQFCTKRHQIPEDGSFLINMFAQQQLDHNFNSIRFNFTKFNESKKLIGTLNKSLKKIEFLETDPDDYINNYFGDLDREVDLRREKIIDKINTYSDELLKKIDALRQECLSKASNQANKKKQ